MSLWVHSNHHNINLVFYLRNCSFTVVALHCDINQIAASILFLCFSTVILSALLIVEQEELKLCCRHLLDYNFSSEERYRIRSGWTNTIQKSPRHVIRGAIRQFHSIQDSKDFFQWEHTFHQTKHLTSLRYLYYQQSLIKQNSVYCAICRKLGF